MSETQNFYRFGLIGYPLAHSRSPEMHHAALAAAGLRGEYRLYPVEPDGSSKMRIATCIEDLRQSKIHGLNVTIPHKSSAANLADCLSTTARGVGAVNTLALLPDGRILGENTDAPGFLRDLKRWVKVEKGRALVIGAGGSARAVVFALAQAGWQVTVLARRAQQAEELVHAIQLTTSGAQITHRPLERETAQQASDGVDLLVNTTPLGMVPETEVSPWFDDLTLPAGAFVYDLIYNPLETQLLRSARREGLQNASGAGMLAAQGALAFALWTGLPEPFDIMEKALLQTLYKEQGKQ